MIDLDAYCARIGYQGPREPTLDVLRDLHRLHPAAIAFEGLDVWLGRPISLEPADLAAKLVAGGRGGYCFEHNSLFKLALQAMGFEAASLIARSIWSTPPDRPPARTHLALRVRLEGRDWLADVGSRPMMTQPIRLDLDAVQSGGREPLRLTRQGAEIRLDTEIEGAWRPVYDIVAEPQLDVDIAAANWFTSTHPAATFRQTLIAWRGVGETRLVLADNQLTVRREGRPVERRRLSADELHRCLTEDFALTPEPLWRDALARAVVAGDQQQRRD